MAVHDAEPSETLSDYLREDTCGCAMCLDTSFRQRRESEGDQERGKKKAGTGSR